MYNMAEDAYIEEKMAHQDSSEEMRRLVWIATGHECIPCEGSTGQSATDLWQEGEVSYYDCDDRLGYQLAYNYEDLGHGMCRVFDIQVLTDERWDHEFDLTHGTLRDALAVLEAQGYDRETLLRVGGKFGIAL